MEKLEKLGLDLLSFPEESDETPTTAISTLPHIPTPLPSAEAAACCIVGVDSGWEKAEDGAIACPQAPLLKDLDSFTEGTGKGSFDSILDDYPYEQGDLFYHPNTLELMPAAPPNIEMWREQVSGPVPDPYEDLEADSAGHFLPSYAEAEGDLGSADLADPTIAYEPRSPISPPTGLPSPAWGSPRAPKRSRSRSPEPSRRIRARPRSKSLSSIQSLTYQILDGLSSAPPWRNFLEPFD